MAARQQAPHRQQQPKKRRSRAFEVAVIAILAVAGTLIAVGILHALPSGPGGSDYRDPAQLAEAMKNAEHGAAASCAKLPAGKYFCSVAYTDRTSGNYTVTVSADGHSYTVN